MDELILRHLNGEATDVEQRRLEHWREAAPANEGRFREVQAVWSGLGSVRSPRLSSRPDPRAMMAEAERRRARRRASRSRMAVLRSPWTGYGIAAAAALVLGFVGLEVWQERVVVGAALATVESSVGSGRVVAIRLSDGSFLRLAEGSTVDFPAESGRREVVLDGRAFFAVAPGGLPFVVRTGGGEVSVTGTRFEVRHEGEELRVVVVEGTVELTASGRVAQVGAGQAGTALSGGIPRVADVDDVWALLDWPGGLLAFQGTSLSDVAEQLEHHFGVDVELGDPTVAERSVTGSFQDESLDDVVETICAVTGIRCERQGDSVVFGAPTG
jgi:transmembrane sensor